MNRIVNTPAHSASKVKMLQCIVFISQSYYLCS